MKVLINSLTIILSAESTGTISLSSPSYLGQASIQKDKRPKTEPKKDIYLSNDSIYNIKLYI